MAQTTVTGVVSDDTGEPLIGVTVLVEGTTTGVVTDIDGTFEITANPTDVLVFSYTGMDEKKITVGNQTQMTVEMTTANQMLNEVVVTGYGNQLRSTYTGAASTAPIERIAQAPRATFAESLAGNVAGVQVNQGSGQPGAFQNVRIRGLGSINAGSNPLYVIDGIPVINEGIGNESTTSTPLSGINPQDIQDVQVLKDASATSIYGSRAANGVIIITTKQGSRGKPKINFNIQSGVSNVSLSDKLQPLNTEEYLEVMREGIINAGRATEATVDQFFADNNINVNNNTSWFDEITQQGTFTTANFSISGGSDKTRYFFSGGYQENEGTIISTDFDRLSTRLNLTTEATDWLEFDVRIAASRTNQNTVPGGGAFANPVRSVYRFVPTQPVRNPDGSYNLNINSGFNVVGQAELNTDVSAITNYQGAINARVDLPFIEGLSYEPYVSIQLVQGVDETFFIPDFGTGQSRNGYGEADFDNRENWLVRNLIKYTNRFNDAHGIDVTLGQEAQKFSSFFVQTLQGNFAFPNLITLSNGSVPESISGTKSENTIESYFANASYNYKGLFYVNGTVRRDGSSRFGADTRYGTFWSLGGAVNLHRLDFLAGNPTISSLRIRASYGVNGNESIGNFASRGLYGTGADYLDNPGILLNQLENANLTWEVNKPFNVGIEIGLWNRIDLIADIYSRRTSDLLFNRPVSRTNGVASVLSNIGELENRGVELTLNTQNFVSQNNGFEWNTSLNVTFNTNEVIALPEGDFADGSRFRAVGQPWSTWYMRGYAGVDVQTGAPLWYTDETETETTTSYNAAELYQHGTSEPDFIGGITNTFRYKGFSLAALVQFDWGRTILHSWHSFTHTDGSRGFSTTGNMARSIYERRWQQPGDVTDTPQVLFAQNRRSRDRSSRFLYDGSYVSLRDVTLSYNFPQAMMQRWGVSNVRLFAQGSNLAIWVKDDRLERDPRTDAGGAIDQEIPIPQTFTFGLDFSF
ncbi:MAG: TonB-dependent receptor [Saprospiraceae bacterium]